MREPSSRYRGGSDARRLLSRRTRAQRALGGLAAIILLASGVVIVSAGGCGGLGDTPAPATGVPTQTQSAGATSSGIPAQAPSVSASNDRASFSLPPSPTATGSAAPTSSAEPRIGIRAKRILIQRLGIDLPIVEGDGIDAPLGKAAHYPGSAWPGEGSNIYLYGHARKGMFIALWEATVGDKAVLRLVDGTERTYVVTAVLPRVPWDAIEYLDPTPTEQLTLQTSTSYYPTAPRFIVIAVPAT